MLGSIEGKVDGREYGNPLGCEVGLREGCPEGKIEGAFVGRPKGCEVGKRIGLLVG